MAAVPPPPARRRPRPGSLQRPLNAQLYRGTLLLVGLPLLIAAFSVARPGPGANDNASGTALLVELARAYSVLTPAHTIVFLSTDGGAFGGLGAAEFAAHSPERPGVVAVINLDAVGSSSQPRLQIGGDTPPPTPGLPLPTAAPPRPK